MLESKEVGVVRFEFGLHFGSVWAVSDDDELCGLVGSGFDVLFDARPVFGEDGEVFFGGDSAAEEEFESVGWDSEWFPDGGVTEGCGELLVVETWGESDEFVWVDSEVGEPGFVVGGS